MPARQRKKQEKKQNTQTNVDNNNKNKQQKQPPLPKSWFKRWILSYFDEVDNITLIIFRIMWGLIMTYECWTFIKSDYSKLNSYYVNPIFAPKYYGFFWVNKWPGDGMYYHIWTMFFAGLGVTFGFMYHLSSFIFFLGFTYLILLDACLYLNHFYLIAVMAFMLVFLPGHKRFAVDSWLIRSWRSNSMPRYIIYLLRFTQVIVYFYAGIAKINEDWLRGEPIRHWIAKQAMSAYNPEQPLTRYVAVSKYYKNIFHYLFICFFM